MRFCIVILLITAIQISFGDIQYNQKCSINNKSVTETWAVGDSGIVIKMTDIKKVTIVKQDILLKGQYNFQCVVFVTPDIGWIIGNKQNKDNTWQSVILKTINGGKNWHQQIHPCLPIETEAPLLRIQAVNRHYAWITCGNGWSLLTHDGGVNWRVTSKPINR